MELIVKSIHLTALNEGQNAFDPRRGNTDVIISLEDGTKYIASFFAYENIDELRVQHQFNGDFLHGSYFWDKNMILAEECSAESIELVLHEIIDEGNFLEVFSKL
jgi:hypothetical protein